MRGNNKANHVKPHYSQNFSWKSRHNNQNIKNMTVQYKFVIICILWQMRLSFRTGKYVRFLAALPTDSE
jgi:hypothetical protein